MVAGPVGAIIGGGIGTFMNSKPERPAAGTAADPLRGISLFFQALGKLAKADGHVSPDEANFAGEILKRMNVSPEVRGILKNEFNRGRDSARSFEDIVSELAFLINSGRMSGASGKDIAEIFCAMVAADRKISPEERILLLNAGTILNARETVMNFFSENGSGDDRRTYRRDSSLSECFKTLGIPETASDEEVKKAWRQKARTFHPDRVQGSGLSEEFIELAKEKLQSINLAYETIRKARGF